MHDFSYENFALSFLIISCFLACKAVKIKSVVVPPTYYLDADNPNPEPLILDCIYDTDEKEDGFVIQWFLNNIIIYQWIAPRTPHALVSCRNIS